jgi:hypothetical protein
VFARVCLCVCVCECLYTHRRTCQVADPFTHATWKMQRGKCNVALAAGGRCTSTCSTEIRCGRWTRPRRRSSSCPSTPSHTACTSGHIDTGTGPTPPTSAPGLAPPRYVLPARPPRRESNAPTCALARIAILTFMVRVATHTGTSDASASVVCCTLSASCMFYVVCRTLGEWQARVVALQARP